MNVRDVIKSLKEDGWELVRTETDHRNLRKEDNPYVAAIPGHDRDDVWGVLSDIRRKSRIDVTMSTTVRSQATNDRQEMTITAIIKRAIGNWCAYTPDDVGVVIATGADARRDHREVPHRAQVTLQGHA